MWKLVILGFKGQKTRTGAGQRSRNRARGTQSGSCSTARRLVNATQTGIQMGGAWKRRGGRSVRAKLEVKAAGRHLCWRSEAGWEQQEAGLSL